MKEKAGIPALSKGKWSATGFIVQRLILVVVVDSAVVQKS